MSVKRKDSKGRILRTGESQRKDLTYQFRYTDVTGKRRTNYANDLQEFGKKEKAIQKDIEDIIRKNPFDFPLTGVVVNDSRKRIALSPQDTGNPLADHHAPCAAPHLLHQHGQCRNGLKEPAITYGTRRCRGDDECLHPCQLRPCAGGYAENPALQKAGSGAENGLKIHQFYTTWWCQYVDL